MGGFPPLLMPDTSNQNWPYRRDEPAPEPWAPQTKEDMKRQAKAYNAFVAENAARQPQNGSVPSVPLRTKRKRGKQ